MNNLVKIQSAIFNVRSLSFKAFVKNDLILLANLDLMFLTESWLHPNDSSHLTELCPPPYDCLSQHKSCGRGGGLVSVQSKTKQKIKCNQTSAHEFTSFGGAND